MSAEIVAHASRSPLERSPRDLAAHCEMYADADLVARAQITRPAGELWDRMCEPLSTDGDS